MMQQRSSLFSSVFILILNFHVCTQQNMIISTHIVLLQIPLPYSTHKTIWSPQRSLKKKKKKGKNHMKWVSRLFQAYGQPLCNFVLLHAQGYFRPKEKSYWFLLRNWIWSSSVYETAFQIKVIHSIYSLKNCIKFPWLEKHTLIQHNALWSFIHSPALLAAVMNAFLILFSLIEIFKSVCFFWEFNSRL